MLLYTLRRLASAIPTVFIIVTLTFFMIRLAPGGPFDLERPLDPLIMANLNSAYNLDAPLWSQYLTYLGNLVQGDLGPSFTKRDFSVNDLFAVGLPVSILLGSLALLVAVMLGTFFGTMAALRQNSGVDYAVVGLATFGITTPTFVVAPLLSLFFGVVLGLAAGRGLVERAADLLDPARRHPGAAAGGGDRAAGPRRDHRGAALEPRADRARLRAADPGGGGRARAAGRDAAGGVLSRADRGRAADRVGGRRDDLRHPRHRRGISCRARSAATTRLVMGTVVVIAIFIIFFNLVVDLLYAVLDPRVRFD